MKITRSILLAFLPLLPTSTYAESENLVVPTVQMAEEQSASYLKDLEELGYCIIPEVLSREEAEVLYRRVWHEFIEKAWPTCRMNDRSNWKEVFPIHNKYGIFAGPAGQIQPMWDLRQDKRIIDVFAKIWNTSDLIVSMDGLSAMCPTEIRQGYFDPWLHVDQTTLRRYDGYTHDNSPDTDFVSESSINTNPYTFQGQFLFEDSVEGDGGFYCIPKSHLKFDEFAPQLESITAEKWESGSAYLLDYFTTHMDDSGAPFEMKHITAPRGSLILWDSRTVHWNQHADENRPYSEPPRVRMVGYLCYVPKARLTEEGRAMRIKAFENGVSTGHNPTWVELKLSKDHVRPGLEKYLEDPSYVQPKINLTSLGESLLGL